VTENTLNEYPSVSIVMPVRNEARNLEKILPAVLEQHYPPGLVEVIVADGESDDSTLQILSRFMQRYPDLKVLNNPDRIVSTGLNHALRVARGEVIIRVDGHTVIAPDYVLQCVQALRESAADNVGGKMNTQGKGVFGETVALATRTKFGVGGARFHYSDNEEWVDTVYLGAWPRKVFHQVGLFDEELVRDQDDEFNYRLREHGGKILLSPKIKSYYTVRSSPWTLWRQYFQYGFWKVRVLQKHPFQMCLRQFVPPIFVAAMICSAGFTTLAPKGIYLLALIAGLYLVMNLSISFYCGLREDWKHQLLLPWVFTILHVSYGLGFLVGLVKFFNRWKDKRGRVPTLRSVDV
jgi:glycosyltransferase involved in cell wall biosynthesis